MELFDKKYVYFEWFDELEGKDCILAKTYQDLKDFVNSGDESRFCKVNKGKEKPFTNLWSECDFCYYDPNLKVKKAWIEGKTIQQECGLSEWKDYTNLPRTSSYFYNINWDAYAWRIKNNLNDFDDIVDYSNYQPTEPRYYLSINKNNSYLEFTISQNITNNTIYIGTRKECERMTKIFCNEFGDCGSCGGEGTSCVCCGKLRHIISKYSHEKYKRRMTNRELSEYLAKGNGEFKNVGYLINTSASYFYQDGAENKNVDNNIFIRDFGSDEWREPLIEV